MNTIDQMALKLCFKHLERRNIQPSARYYNLYIAEALTTDFVWLYQQLVTVQPIPKRPAINDYVYCQFEESYPIVADSLNTTNKFLWHKANGILILLYYQRHLPRLLGHLTDMFSNMTCDRLCKYYGHG